MNPQEVLKAWEELAGGTRSFAELSGEPAAVADIVTAGKRELFGVVDMSIKAIAGWCWERHPAVELTPGFGIDTYQRGGEGFGQSMVAAMDVLTAAYEAGMLVAFTQMEAAFTAAEKEQARIRRREERRGNG